MFQLQELYTYISDTDPQKVQGHADFSGNFLTDFAIIKSALYAERALHARSVVPSGDISFDIWDRTDLLFQVLHILSNSLRILIWYKSKATQG